MTKKVLYLLFLSCTIKVALSTDWSSVGKSKMAHVAGASWDQYTSNPSTTTKQWINDHQYRLISYTPYFDAKVRKLLLTKL